MSGQTKLLLPSGGSLQLGAADSAQNNNVVFPAKSGIITVDDGSGIGYNTGSGGSVVQNIDKATLVTLNKPCGKITLAASSIAANSVVVFQFNNSVISSTDVPQFCVSGGDATGGSYLVSTVYVSTGNCLVAVRNLTASPRAEAVVLNFVVIKGVTA